MTDYEKTRKNIVCLRMTVSVGANRKAPYELRISPDDLDAGMETLETLMRGDATAQVQRYGWENQDTMTPGEKVLLDFSNVFMAVPEGERTVKVS